MTFYNLVNHHLNLIVCFNPKCACTTLKDWFLHSLPVDEDQTRRCIGPHGIPPKEIIRNRGYTKILFVRDPFRRLVSFYCGFVVRDTRNWCFADANQNYPLHGKSFSEFLQILEELAGQGLAFQHHLQPQIGSVCGIRFDMVIAIERLEQQLSELNSTLAIKYDVPKHNATPYSESANRYSFDASPECLALEAIPIAEYFFNPTLVARVEKLYNEDLTYYRAYHDDCILFQARFPFIVRWKSRFRLAKAWKKSVDVATE
jgi:hypothetical protein